MRKYGPNMVNQDYPPISFGEECGRGRLVRFAEELHKVVQLENLRNLTGNSPEVRKALRSVRQPIFRVSEGFFR